MPISDKLSHFNKMIRILSPSLTKYKMLYENLPIKLRVSLKSSAIKIRRGLREYLHNLAYNHPISRVNKPSNQAISFYRDVNRYKSWIHKLRDPEEIGAIRPMKTGISSELNDAAKEHYAALKR